MIIGRMTNIRQAVSPIPFCERRLKEASNWRAIGKQDWGKVLEPGAVPGESGTLSELTQRAGLAPPEIKASVGEVIARFRPTAYIPPLRIGHDLSDLQRQLLDVLSQTGPTAMANIMGRLPAGTARRTVQENLKLLYELGQVDFSGSRRWTRWRLKGAPDPRA